MQYTVLYTPQGRSQGRNLDFAWDRPETDPAVQRVEPQPRALLCFKQPEETHL
jgi:hypothetical protein